MAEPENLPQGFVPNAEQMNLFARIGDREFAISCLKADVEQAKARLREIQAEQTIIHKAEQAKLAENHVATPESESVVQG